MGHLLLFLVMGNELRTCIWHWSFWYDDMIYEFLNFFSLSCRTMFLFSILREMPRAFQQVEKFLNAGKGRSGLHRILHLAPASVDDGPSTLILQVVELSTWIIN